MLDDTIAAIATPLGEGGLAVIRLSGPQALAVADRCFRPPANPPLKPSAAPTHTIHFGHVVRHGQDRGRGPARRHARPAHLHARGRGGDHLPRRACCRRRLVLDTVLANGARLAEPGEFTRRAFLNGRIDLAQAEAVADLIHSRTELALRAANEQLAGKLSQRINQLRDDLLKTLAHVEAHIDFPDEDIAPDTRDQLLARLRAGLAFMDELLRTANEGQILRRGIRAAIIGRPNAGKSSLLNQLLGHDRAIVSPIPGTTRDTIEETANIRGLPVVFIDTAGLREAAQRNRTGRRPPQPPEPGRSRIHPARPRRLRAADRRRRAHLAEFAGKKRILVRNKIDLPPQSPIARPAGAGPRRLLPDRARGSKTLKDAIKELVWAGEIRAEMLQVMINSRHQDALQPRPRRHRGAPWPPCTAGQTLELVALDLRIAANAVGEIVGKTTTEDLLDSIFSQFCIGK